MIRLRQIGQFPRRAWRWMLAPVPRLELWQYLLIALLSVGAGFGIAQQGAYPQPSSGNSGAVLCTQGIIVGTQCISGNFNTQQDVTCTFNATTTITCSDAPFVASDADGKHHISAYSTCKTNAVGYLSEFGTTAVTITAFVSSSQVTVSTATSGSISGTGCIYKGTPDSAAFTAADAAIAASKMCPAVVLPAARAWLTHGDGGHLSIDPNSCAINPSVSGISYFGGGMAVIGQGWGTSEIFFDNTFVSGDTYPLMTLPFDGIWRDWGATGGGNPMNGVGAANGEALFKISNYAAVLDWKCTNLGQTEAGSSLLPNGQGGGPAGVWFTGYDIATNYANDGCGLTGTYSASSTFFAPSFADTGALLTIPAGNTVTLYFPEFNSTPYTPFFLEKSYGSTLIVHGGGGNLNGANSLPGFVCAQAGCVYKFDQGFGVNVAGGSATGIALEDGGFATTVYLNDAILEGGTSGNSILGTSASSVLYSQNVANSLIGPISWSGKSFTTAPQQGTCAMVSATTCTVSLTSISTTPTCTATDSSAGTLASKCAYSSGTITVTAPASNSDTWAVTLY